MTDSQRTMLAMSETREALNAILAVPVADRTDEQTADRDRLTKEIQELEPEFRAALASEDWGRQERTETVDAEERERRELRSKVSLSGYVKAAAARTLPDAEYREYNAAVGAEPNEVPLDLLGQVERRAVTPGPTDDATDAIAPYVFERTICEQLAPGCIRMTPTGPCFSVTMTTAPAAAATVLAKDADAVATAGAFTPSTARPRVPISTGCSTSRRTWRGRAPTKRSPRPRVSSSARSTGGMPTPRWTFERRSARSPTGRWRGSTSRAATTPSTTC
jgi:hypothetical protein